VTKNLISTAGELRKINEEREKLIFENCEMKKERFEAELCLTEKENILEKTKRELDQIELRLRTFNNSSISLLSDYK